MSKIVFKQFILVVILLLLFVPLIQKTLPFVELKTLKGVFTLAEKPDSIQENWFTGEYQLHYEKYFNDSIGFRPLFVRIKNQINYSLFNTISTENVISGKENFILDEKYIFANYGFDFIGKKYLEAQADKLKFIQYKLKKDYNIDLVVVLAPSKISYFVDKTPEKYAKFKQNSNNYLGFKQQFLNKNINYLDFNQWFNTMKDTISFELFPKYGIHWSNYGAILATDSLIKYISNNKAYNVPKLKIQQPILTDSMAIVDNDVTSSMNLLFDPTYTKMPYTKYDVEKPSVKNLKPLFIGDSYCNGILNTGIIQQISLETGFFYYNRTYKIGADEKEIDCNNYLSLIKKFNYIILLNTELNYWNLGHGFIDITYKELMPEMNTQKEKELFLFYYKSEKLDSIQAINKAKYIVSNPLEEFNLYKDSQIELHKKRLLNGFVDKSSLIKKAKERNVSVDEMAFIDARYLFYNSSCTRKTREAEIRENIELNYIIDKIKIDKKKIEKIKLFVSKTNVSFENALLEYAKNEMNGEDNSDGLFVNSLKTNNLKQVNVTGKDDENEIQNIISRIRNDKEWFNTSVQQAKERNISIEEMLRKNAVFTIKNRKK